MYIGNCLYIYLIFHIQAYVWSSTLVLLMRLALLFATIIYFGLYFIASIPVPFSLGLTWLQSYITLLLIWMLIPIHAPCRFPKAYFWGCSFRALDVWITRCRLGSHPAKFIRQNWLIVNSRCLHQCMAATWSWIIAAQNFWIISMFPQSQHLSGQTHNKQLANSCRGENVQLILVIFALERTFSEKMGPKRMYWFTTD